MVLAAAAKGLFICLVCPPFSEFRGIRPGRTDFFSETGLSWNDKRKSQQQKQNKTNHLLSEQSVTVSLGNGEAKFFLSDCNVPHLTQCSQVVFKL